MGSTDFKELKNTPDKLRDTAAMVAPNVAHLVRLLKAEPFPVEAIAA